MELILKRPLGSLTSEFQSKWHKYVPAILELSQTYSKKTQKALEKIYDYRKEVIFTFLLKWNFELNINNTCIIFPVYVVYTTQQMLYIVLYVLMNYYNN